MRFPRHCRLARGDTSGFSYAPLARAAARDAATPLAISFILSGKPSSRDHKRSLFAVS
jgi:hypothetical protein